MTLQEAKLVLDWAKEKYDDYKSLPPELHENSIETKVGLFKRYILLENLYDKMCEDWIKNNIENKQLNNPSL